MRPQETTIKTKENKKKWVIFPDSLNTGRFGGFNAREDETQIRGDFVIGQNITFANARIPTIRTGYEVIGTEVADATPVTRSWVFENRNGDQFELKAYDTYLDYWLVGESTAYQHLLTGLTANKEFGYGNIGKTADTTNHTNFCNGVDGFYKFDGAWGKYASNDGVNQITLQGTTSLADLGFYASGSIVINGVAITYTGLSAQTFTGCSAIPVGPTVGDLVVQKPEIVSALASFKSSVIMAHDGRLHARLETKKSIWNYSKLDDPYDWTAAASDGAGGAKEVEFGGPITAFNKLFKTALCFKKNIIKALSFEQVGTRIDTPVYKTLITVDDKGTTLGAINQKSTISTPLGVAFVTPDKRMVLLTGVTANNEPQYLFLSDQIQPIFTQGVHDTASAICVDNVIWYAFKQDIKSSYNDVVLRGDLTRQTTTSDGKTIPIQWDAPYIGWNVSDWTVVYDETLGKNIVHWHSSINSNTYKISDSKTDNTSSFSTTLRTWSENFGLPLNGKKIDYAYLEVKMTENTQLLVTLMYDEDGSTGMTEYILKGDGTAYRFNSSIYNPFGSSPYGSQKIGSNELSPDLKKYRFYLETENNLYFYNLSLQISTSVEGCDYQLIRWGARLTEMLEEPDKKYKISVNS